jgi:hypothetical protein
VVATATVPDFFQEDTTDALRSQVEWLTREVALDDAFFARLVRTDSATFLNWRAGEGVLPPGGEDTLRQFWSAVLHLLSFFNFDSRRVRELFEHHAPVRPVAESPLTPPWCGSTLRAYLERAGGEAVERVAVWVTGLRFGDLYAA